MSAPARPRLLSVRLHEDDPCVGTVEVDVPGKGVLTQTYEWATPELAREHLPRAAEQALTIHEAREVGESRKVTRFTTRAGTVYLGWLGGPPTWHLPKVGLRRKPGYIEVMAGWWRRAAVLGWHYHQPPTAAPEAGTPGAGGTPRLPTTPRTYRPHHTPRGGD